MPLHWRICLRASRAARAASVAAALAVAAVGSGCASLEEITAGHVGCPASEVSIVEDHIGWSTRNWVAQCRGHRFHCITQSSDRSSQTTCSPEPVLETSAAPMAAVPTSGGDAFDLERDDPSGTWRLSVIESGVGRERLRLLRCLTSSHLPARGRVSIDAEGRVLAPVWEGSLVPAEEACLEAALSSVDLVGSVGAGRTVRIEVSGTGVRAASLAEPPPPPVPIAPATPSVETPPASPGTPGPTDDAAASAVRAALTARAEIILSCTDGSPVAIQASWEASGVVTVALSGSRAGTSVEGCVRAAVGALTVAASAPGALLHPIAAP